MELSFRKCDFKGDKKRATALYEGTNALTPEDIADAIHWVVTRPARVNINSLQLMPVSQAFAGLTVKKA